MGSDTQLTLLNAALGLNSHLSERHAHTKSRTSALASCHRYAPGAAGSSADTKHRQSKQNTGTRWRNPCWSRISLLYQHILHL